MTQEKVWELGPWLQGTETWPTLGLSPEELVDSSEMSSCSRASRQCLCFFFSISLLSFPCIDVSGGLCLTGPSYTFSASNLQQYLPNNSTEILRIDTGQPGPGHLLLPAGRTKTSQGPRGWKEAWCTVLNTGRRRRSPRGLSWPSRSVVYVVSPRLTLHLPSLSSLSALRLVSMDSIFGRPFTSFLMSSFFAALLMCNLHYCKVHPFQIHNSLILSNFITWCYHKIHSSLFAVAPGKIQNLPFLDISYNEII